MVRFVFSGIAIFLSWSSVWEVLGQQEVSGIRLVYPTGLALNSDHDLYISDIGTHQILRLTDGGELVVIAGTGAPGFGGDGEPSEQAQLFAPHDIAFDSDDNLLIADTLNHRVRRIDGSGVITTVAGNGVAAAGGDDGPAVDASLNGPQDLEIDREGAILIADTFNNVVRRIDLKGVITTIAGTEPGLSGDGGSARGAELNLPNAVTVSPDGTVYISDAGNSRIRRITTDGNIETVVGHGVGYGLGGAGFMGDGGPATKAKIFSAAGLDFDTSGKLYISDSGNNRIRVVVYEIIRTVAGSGESGFWGDGEQALSAALNTPQKIVVGPDDSLFIADRANGRIRTIDSRGVIRTIVGEGVPPGILVDPNI